MKRLLMVFAMLILVASVAFAAPAPSVMTDAQMDQIVAGKIFYVWTNKDGETFLNPFGSGSPYIPGHKKGWVSEITSCDTATGLCGNGGTITNTLGQWVYTAP